MPLVTAAGIEAVASGASGADEAALRAAVRTGARRSAGPAARGVRVPAHVRGGADPADGRGPARHRPRLWPRPARPRAARSWPRPSSAPLLGVPSVTHSFGTAVPVGILDDSAERLAGLWQAHGLEVPPYAGCFRAGYLDICPPSVQTMPVDHIAAVQPLRPVGGRPGACAGGTARLRHPGHRPAAVRTCCARSWPASPRCRSAVLVAVGPAGRSGALGEQPAHVQVESWVDQAEVLGRCSAVVSHGGSGHLPGCAGARAAPALPAAGAPTSSGTPRAVSGPAPR